MSVELPERIEGTSDLLVLCDHASNRVPTGIDLGVGSDIMAKHIAIDIGAADVARRVAQALDARAVLATVSRLVIDLHREPDHAGLIPAISDGMAIPGNARPDRDDRIARFHSPYHAAIEAAIAEKRPALIAAIHSFTPALESGGGDRPWQIGILYNQDGRAAGIALAALRERGIVTGDNEPYSGHELNATLNRHGEANGIPCLSIEIRNDLIRDAAGVTKWAAIVEEMLRGVGNSLASQGPSAT